MDEYVYSDREKLGKMTEERDELQVRIKELEAIVEIARMEQGRVKELETRAAKEAQETIEMEAELNRRIEVLEADLIAEHDLCGSLAMKAQLAQERLWKLESRNAALVAASGQGVTWEYDLDARDTLYDARLYLNKRSAEGWQFVEPLIMSHNKWVVCVRRPARPESEGSE